MKRALCFAAILCSVLSLHAQTPSQYALFVCNNITDLAGNKLASGTFTATPVLTPGSTVPAAPQLVSGGRGVALPITFNVTGGVCSAAYGAAQLVDVTQANPAKFCYATQIHDNNTGDTWNQDSCLQPAYNATGCTVTAGQTTCDYDNMVPPGTPGALQVTGPPGLNWKGAWSAGTYQLNDAVSCGVSSYVNTIPGNTAACPGTGWTLLASGTTVAVGTTTAGAAGSSPVVTNSGSGTNAMFNFQIPGSPTVAIGTVTTGAPGSSATVSNGGTPYAVSLNFQIPQGLPALVGKNQGAWTGSPTTYNLGDLVSYSGNSYVSFVNGNTGNEPDISPSDWGMLANLSSLPAAFASQSAANPNGGTFTQVQQHAGSAAAMLPWLANGARSIQGLQISSTCTAGSLITAYSGSGTVLTLTGNNSYVAGDAIAIFAPPTDPLYPINGLPFTVLSSGLSTTHFAIAASSITGSGSSSARATDRYAVDNSNIINSVAAVPFSRWVFPLGVVTGEDLTIPVSGVEFFGMSPTNTPVNGGATPSAVSTLCNQDPASPMIRAYNSVNPLEPMPTIRDLYFLDPSNVGQTWAICLGGSTTNGACSQTSSSSTGDFPAIDGDTFDGFAGFVGGFGVGNGVYAMSEGLRGHAGTYTSGNFLLDFGGGSTNSTHVGKVAGDCGPSGVAPSVPGLIRFRSGVGNVVEVGGDASNCYDVAQTGVVFPVTSTSATYSSGTNTTTILVNTINDAAAIGLCSGTDLVRLEELRSAPVASWVAPSHVQATLASCTPTQLTLTVSGSVSGVPYSTTTENAAWVVDTLNGGSRADIRVADDECNLGTCPTMVQGVAGFGGYVNWWTGGMGGNAGDLFDSPFINTDSQVLINTSSQGGIPLTSGTITNVSASSGVCTVTASNTIQAGEYGYCNQLSSGSNTWLNWQNGGNWLQFTSGTTSSQITFACNQANYSAAETTGHCYVQYPIGHDIGSGFTKVTGPMVAAAMVRTPADMVWSVDKILHSADAPGQYVPNSYINSVSMPPGPLYNDFLRRYTDGSGISHIDYGCSLASGKYSWCPMLKYGSVSLSGAQSITSSMLPYSAILMQTTGSTLSLVSQPGPSWCGMIYPNGQLNLALSGGATYNGSGTLPFTQIFAPIQICADSTNSANFFGPLSAPAVSSFNGYTVGTLPSCGSGQKGQSAAVTDGASPTYLGTLTGGGSTYTPVVCNGSGWVSF